MNARWVPEWIRKAMKPRKVVPDWLYSPWLQLFLPLTGFAATIAAWHILQTDTFDRSHRIFMVLMPVPFLLLLQIASYRQRLAGHDPVDELQRRIELEGYAFSYSLSTPVLWTVCMLQVAIPFSPSSPAYRLAWLVLPISQTLGNWLARRRYLKARAS